MKVPEKIIAGMFIIFVLTFCIGSIVMPMRNNPKPPVTYTVKTQMGHYTKLQFLSSFYETSIFMKDGKKYTFSGTYEYIEE